MSWLIVNESSFTRFGRFYLTMNFLMHIVMALWSNVLMESFIDCFCAFSHTRRIIQKSKFSFRRAEWSKGLIAFRVLLAMIWDKGICPCPRCMIPKKDFCCLGFISDASQWISKIHLYLHNQVAAACNAIYKLGAPIKGAFPESQLKDFSLVPTFVCYSLLVSASIDHTFVTRTHLLIYLDPLDSTSIVRLWSIYYMSLSWVFLNQYSGIFYVYFMQHLGPVWWPLLMRGMVYHIWPDTSWILE